MRFSDIRGHEDVKARLRQMADSGRIPHALLLYGAQGVGKTMLARAFAQYINCSRRHGGDSCGICPECRQTQALNNPDVHYIFPVIKKRKEKMPVSSDWSEEWGRMLSEHPWMEPESWNLVTEAGNTQPMIYVDDTDEIIKAAAMSSYSSDYKIFIVWQADKMGQEAANKLLKVLEEPFGDTIFIFLSNNVEALLPTIFSRLQRIEVPRMSDDETRQILLDAGYSAVTAAKIAVLAHGRPGAALAMASENSESREFADLYADAMRYAYAMKGDRMKSMSENLAALGREKCMRLLDYFSAQTRENFIYNLGVGELNSMTDREEAFSCKFAPFINVTNVEGINAEIDRARTDISRNANGKIVWFDLLLKLMVLLRRK